MLAWFLIDFLRFKTRFLKSLLAIPRYTFLGFSDDITVHYVDDLALTIYRTFRFYAWIRFFDIFVVKFFLWHSIMLYMFCVHVYPTFTTLLLKIPRNLLDLGKCSFIRFKSILAKLLEKYLLKSGLNQIMLWERYRFCFMSFLFAEIKLTFF